MDAEEMKEKTKAFALCVIKLVEGLPNNRISNILCKQLLRSGTSVGANYRSACRAKSQADFIAKMGIVEEEGDESMYWMELLIDSGITNEKDVKPLLVEANQIVAITVTSIKTARMNK
ncbi:MAG: four helix bundle protein [Candidatus Anammoxibacter sp.]